MITESMLAEAAYALRNNEELKIEFTTCAGNAPMSVSYNLEDEAGREALRRFAGYLNVAVSERNTATRRPDADTVRKIIANKLASEQLLEADDEKLLAAEIVNLLVGIGLVDEHRPTLEELVAGSRSPELIGKAHTNA